MNLLSFVVLITVCFTNIMSVYAERAACTMTSGVVSDAECACNQTHVNCFELTESLLTVPSNISTDALDIDLSYNRLTEIKENDLLGMEKLETLSIPYNDISKVHPMAFKSLFSLRILDISYNGVKEMDKYAFLRLASRKVEIVFDYNNLKCNCELMSIRESLKNVTSSEGYSSVLSTVECETAMGHFEPLDKAQFGPCADTADDLYDQSSTCSTCEHAETSHACVQSSVVLCERTKNMCHSEIVLKAEGLSLSTSCEDLNNCITKELNDSHSCIFSGKKLIRCSFCCYWDECLINRFGGRTVDYRFELTFVKQNQTFYTSWSSRAKRTEQLHQIMTAVLNRLTVSVPGGVQVVDVSFHLTSDGKYLYIIHMEATVVNTYSSELTRLTIQKDLELSARNPSESMWIGVDVDSIFVSDPESIHCPAFEIKKMNYTLQYNESYVGETRIQNIPLPDSILQLKAKCIAEDGIAKWGEVVEEHVPYTTTQNINNLAQAELLLNITDNTNIVQFIRELEYLTEETILKTPGVAEYILLSIGELEKLELDGSSAGRVLEIIESVSNKVSLTSGMYKHVNPTIALVSYQMNTSRLGGVELTVLSNSHTDLTTEKINGNLDCDSMTLTPGVSSIHIPVKSLESIFGTVEPIEQNTRLSFVIQLSDKLFAVQDRSNSLIVNSQILSVITPKKEVTKLHDNVTIGFTHYNTKLVSPVCVFWKKHHGDDFGSWSSDGCSLVQTTERMSVCTCNHVTNFALLMDVYGQQRQASTDATDDEVLSYISHIGCAISFVALLITVLIYTMFSRLRRDEPSKILYNMCWGLLAFNLCFLLGLAINDDTDAVWCKGLAASMHYSLLAAMFWMAVNAYHMHLSLIRVFNTYIDNFYLKCALAGWGSPFIFVAITLAINKTDNYGLISSHLCWIKHPAIYYGLIAPVACIIFVNCIVFLKILRLIEKMSTTNSSAISNFRATASLFILLGLTWIFAFCAFGKFRIVFNYLFAIFNSIQGLFIFTFYCMLKQEVVISLKKLCNIKSDDSKAQKPKAGEISTMSTYQEISRASTDQDSRQLEPKVVRKN